MLSPDWYLQIAFNLFKHGELPWHSVEAIVRELGFKGCDLVEGKLLVKC